MLQSLTIKNTAIIDSLTVEFGDKMNCMTGETGAGKSIILDSLCCLLGERVSKDSIRKGASEASVTGVFYIQNQNVYDLLSELGIEREEDDTIILFRSYSETKNVCRINGNAVTLSALRKLGELLVDVHGQHDNHALLSEASHIVLLDLFAGNEIEAKKAKLRENLAAIGDIEDELEKLSGDPKKRAQLIDLYNYQIDEITSAGLKNGEEDDLLAKQKFFDNQEIITKYLAGTAEILSGTSNDYESRGAYDMLCNCEGMLTKLANLGEKYEEALQKVRDAKFAIEDAEDFVNDLLDSCDFDPSEAKRVSDRLDILYELKQKYGNSIPEILKYCDSISEELEKISASEATVASLNEKKKTLLNETEQVALEIRKLRNIAAKSLEEGVMKNLSDMEMSKVKFGIKIEPRESSAGLPDFNKNGLDNVRFLVSTNPSEDLKPLTKIASGGELSRIMLAIKSVLADIDEIPVLVFDEIDTGISGTAAGKVAEKFSNIAKNHQLICVSHLAQIAAIADTNIVVNKTIDDTGARSFVSTVSAEEKVKEIARLLDGNAAGDLSLAHAREMINKAQTLK